MRSNAWAKDFQLFDGLILALGKRTGRSFSASQKA
jgi:hypothetical protein